MKRRVLEALDWIDGAACRLVLVGAVVLGMALGLVVRLVYAIARRVLR